MNTNPAGRPVGGLEDIQALAVAAVTALQEAGLPAEAQAIHTRVLSRDPGDLLEQVSAGPQMVWTFKPFVELLMREVRDLAAASDLSLEERREQIGWTLDVAGF